MINTEQNLRQNIMLELKKLTATNSPALFAMMQTDKGYLQLEKIIIEKVIDENLPPIAIIPQLETELSLAADYE